VNSPVCTIYKLAAPVRSASDRGATGSARGGDLWHGPCSIDSYGQSPLGGIAMLGWAITFFVIALIAAVLGFSGIAGAASSIAQILFFVFLVLLVVAGVAAAVRGRPPV
jgi:uncharacterized membrane protein YtjA (UPF0391 family)